jgi:probable HAF family extracellular repeat protein
MTGLGTLPGGLDSSGSAINNHGQLVGNAYTTSGYPHAFRWENGVMTGLGTLPGGLSSGAVAINDHGQAIGTASNSSGFYRAVLYQ